jgi:transposase-like protein
MIRLELKDFRKNSIKKGKQNHICSDYRCQFIKQYETTRNYSNEMKRDSVKIYVNGMGFRGKELIKGDHHNNRHYQRSL